MDKRKAYVERRRQGPFYKFSMSGTVLLHIQYLAVSKRGKKTNKKKKLLSATGGCVRSLREEMDNHELEIERARLISLAMEFGFDEGSAMKCLDRLVNLYGWGSSLLISLCTFHFILIF